MTIDSTLPRAGSPDDDKNPGVFARPADPLLTPDDWERLQEIAPELVHASESLAGLGAGVGTDPSLDASDLLLVLKGIEHLSRVTASTEAVVLARAEYEVPTVDYGAKTLPALVTRLLRIDGAAARRRVRFAHAIGAGRSLTGARLEPAYPHVALALADGGVSVDQAQAVIREIEKIPHQVRHVHHATAERLLVDTVPSVDVDQVRVLGSRIRAYLDPDGRFAEVPPLVDEYHVTVTPRRNGAWNLTGLLDPVTGGKLHGLLTNRQEPGVLVEDATGAGAVTEVGGLDAVPADTVWGEGAGVPGGGAEPGAGLDEPGCDLPPGDLPASAVTVDGQPTTKADHPFGYRERPDGARRHDMFATLIDRAAGSGPQGAGMALVVTATAEEYAQDKAEVESTAGPIGLQDLESLSPGALVYFQATQPGTREVTVHSASRFATRRQVELIAARDRGCTFPGCDMPVGWCDAHHMIPWSSGGPTTVANLTLACRFHHTWHDQHGWRAELIGGLPAWIPPRHVDLEQRPVFHSRFAAALVDVSAAWNAAGLPPVWVPEDFSPPDWDTESDLSDPPDPPGPPDSSKTSGSPGSSTTSGTGTLPATGALGACTSGTGPPGPGTPWGTHGSYTGDAGIAPDADDTDLPPF
ncbi:MULTISPECIES: HNH endonuclease signature motif containing protein [Brevibacterium]|uniref:HNH endonuclease signature motif containing protein n=1 Tax=Brevibacterium TaxID=1696 RepID=UPI00211BC88F|nr:MULTISPECIES: HNH endonuclease signature motif containing protein [unclassified Brevibacterium]MCQ9385050.1 HNH endonuclease [Brevibacterium sp. 68QC2CO]